MPIVQDFFFAIVKLCIAQVLGKPLSKSKLPSGGKYLNKVFSH
jgi:hypothetical protein